MHQIAKEGIGALVVIRREEDDKFLVERIHQYQMEDHGVEFTPNTAASEDWRMTGTGAQILADLGIRKLKVLGSSRKKFMGLSGYGLEVVEFVAAEES